MPVLNWCYGAKSVDNEDKVNEAIYLAHKYRNALCAAEIERRKRFDGILRELAPGYLDACSAVENLEAQLEHLRKQIQVAKVKQRTKSPTGVGHLTASIKSVKDQLKAARAARKEAKDSAFSDPAVMDAIAKERAYHKSVLAQAKQESGLYWGTESLVRSSCERFSSGTPPRFKPYDGTGQLAVQLQCGLDCNDADVQNTLFYLGDQIGNKREIFFRVGSEHRKPVFARVVIVMHRPLPSGRIKWAYLEKRKIANRVKWSVRLSIDVPPRMNKNSEEKWCALHVGWLATSSGIRTATWKGYDGASGSVKLPKSHVSGYKELDKTRSKRGLEFNRIRDAFCAWLKENHDIPQWLSDACEHISKWRSPARLSKLIWTWMDNRFDGDGIFGSLNEWRKRDKVLWQHESRLSYRLSRRRRDYYRCVAKSLAKHYGTIYLAVIETSELVKNGEPEEGRDIDATIHRNAMIASTSEFIRFVGERFPLRLIDVGSQNITAQCSDCGKINDYDGRSYVCVKCSEVQDVDKNALANTIARGEAMRGGALAELAKKQQEKEAATKDRLRKMQEANRAARKSKKKIKEIAG